MSDQDKIFPISYEKLLAKYACVSDNGAIRLGLLDNLIDNFKSLDSIDHRKLIHASLSVSEKTINNPPLCMINILSTTDQFVRFQRLSLFERIINVTLFKRMSLSNVYSEVAEHVCKSNNLVSCMYLIGIDNQYIFPDTLQNYSIPFLVNYSTVSFCTFSESLLKAELGKHYKKINNVIKALFMHGHRAINGYIVHLNNTGVTLIKLAVCDSANNSPVAEIYINLAYLELAEQAYKKYTDYRCKDTYLR